MANRTTVTFTHEGELWPLVDQWATQNGFRSVTTQESARLLQKGSGFFVAPMMVDMELDNNQVRLEAWIQVGLLARILSLFILPGEMSIESGGVRAALPRSIARKAVNNLLASLNQPPIP
ncbi:hypothetical protein KKF84_01450 [Myxococcota bacterium]|nr:hypothetical protein [Myxococcota bacterium]MBU1533950.1 hypothetical protein [Myxococcota bacterium]